MERELPAPFIAARLSEDPAVEVVLSEAGKENNYEPSRTQGGVSALFRSEADWNETDASAGRAGLLL